MASQFGWNEKHPDQQLSVPGPSLGEWAPSVASADSSRTSTVDEWAPSVASADSSRTSTVDEWAPSVASADSSRTSTVGGWAPSVASADSSRTSTVDEWAPSVASADSVLDPYIASLALTYCPHFLHLDLIHQVGPLSL
jgi:hypothetical protein